MENKILYQMHLFVFVKNSVAEYFANLKKKSGGISANSGPVFHLFGTA
jgi:hypothetical protein